MPEPAAPTPAEEFAPAIACPLFATTLIVAPALPLASAGVVASVDPSFIAELASLFSPAAPPTAACPAPGPPRCADFSEVQAASTSVVARNDFGVTRHD